MTRHLPLFAVLIVGLAMCPATLRAASPGDVDAVAATNALYESGRYVEAALVYEQLIDRGYESATLYYNLGNTYYKQGDKKAKADFIQLRKSLKALKEEEREAAMT